MGTITLSHTLTPGAVENVSDVQDNFNDIVNEVNGNLDGDNIASDAALSVASVTTSGTVTATGGLKGDISLGGSADSTIWRGGVGEISYRTAANIHIFRSAGTSGTADGQLYAAGYNVTSGRQLKRNIRDCPGVAIARKLRGVRFEFAAGGAASAGVIAEEVAQVMPELVTRPTEDSEPTVNMLGLIAPLIEAVKELADRLERLEARR